jgi:hypothetical protein
MFDSVECCNVFAFVGYCLFGKIRRYFLSGPLTAYNNQLRALLTKRAEQVDYHLNSIFLTLAAPCILHSKCHNSSSYKNE